MSDTVKDKRLWTFIVRNGEPFKLQVPGNPPIEYEGGSLEILKAVATEDTAEGIRQVAAMNGCHVVMKTEYQTDEQYKERQELLGVERGDVVWPCELCPGCSLFDPHIEGYCGAQSWPEESLQVIAQMRKLRQDLVACPLKRGKDLL